MGSPRLSRCRVFPQILAKLDLAIWKTWNRIHREEPALGFPSCRALVKLSLAVEERLEWDSSGSSSARFFPLPGFQ